MANVIPLQQPEPTALARYRRLLIPPINAYSALIPLDALPALEREIAASLKPGHPREVHEAIEALRAIQHSSTIDPEALSEGLHIKLAEYPVDILQEAVSYAWGKVEWLTIAGMVTICEQLIEPRRKLLRAVAHMEAEHRRRQQDATEPKAQAELAAKREMDLEAHREAHRQRLRDLEVRSRERLGDVAPRPGDLELADSLSKPQVYRVGKPISWLAALAEGELWAAKYCRQMALAERAKRAIEQGRVSSEDVLATAKLISADEESARCQIEEIECRPVNYRDRPTESFWRALFRSGRRGVRPASDQRWPGIARAAKKSRCRSSLHQRPVQMADKNIIRPFKASIPYRCSGSRSSSAQGCAIATYDRDAPGRSGTRGKLGCDLAPSSEHRRGAAHPGWLGCIGPEKSTSAFFIGAEMTCGFFRGSAAQ